MSNESLRRYAKNHNVCLWQIANYMNVSESTVTRMFRKELTDEEKEKIVKIIDQITSKCN